MNLDHRDGLLFSDMVIFHYGRSIKIPNVIIDTGAVESIISIDAVEDLFNAFEPEDELRFMTGIGGREASVRRKVQGLEFHSFRITDFPIDFGRVGEDPRINGLIGLDILIPGRFIVDLHRMQIYSSTSNNGREDS